VRPAVFVGGNDVRIDHAMPEAPAELALTQDDLRRVVTHAVLCEPLESCGILAGSPDGRVSKLYPMTNAAASATEFVMDAKEQFEVFDDIVDSGLEPLAVYHSHPATPPDPSPRDVARASYPAMAWLIVSLRRGQPICRAHRIRDGAVTELPLRIILPDAADATDALADS
jgi:proteasome lid subunit RPN8/RPN11